MNATDYYALLFSAAGADGEIQDAERAQLDSFAQRLRLSPSAAREIEADIGDGRAVKLTLPKRASDRERTLRHLIRIVAADGKCTPAELRLLRSLASRLEIPMEQIKEALQAAGPSVGNGGPQRNGCGYGLCDNENESVAESSSPLLASALLKRQILFLGLAIPTIGAFVATPNEGTSLVAMTLYVLIAAAVWRCPGCGAQLSVREFMPLNCSTCGAALSASVTRERWRGRINGLVVVLVIGCGFGIQAIWALSERSQATAVEAGLRAETERRIDRVMAALKIYQDRQQADPQALSELIEPLWPHERDRYKGPYLEHRSLLKDAWGDEYWFHVSGDSIEVRSSGGFKGGFPQPEKHIKRTLKTWMAERASRPLKADLRR